MADLYLLNGSNVGDRFQNLDRATELLSQMFGLLIAKSAIYETQAWGKETQRNFYNQAIHFKVDEEPENILKATKKIETTIGERHIERWSARKMDIDLIFYGDLIYQSDALHIPHRLMHLTIQQLLEHSNDDLKVQKLTTINEI